MDEIGNLDSLQKVDSKELSLGVGQYSDTYAKELYKEANRGKI